MKRKELEKVLASMTKQEREVYDRRIKRDLFKDIALQMHTSESNLYNKINPRIFGLFKVKNWDELYAVLDHLEEDSDEKQVPKPLTEEASHQLQTSASVSNLNTTPRNNTWKIVFPVIIVIVLFTGWLIGSRFPLNIGPIPSSIPTSIATSKVINTPKSEIPTSIASVNSSVNTLTPSSEPALSSTATTILSPTLTSVPPGTVLFEDNFENGLSKKWEILSGTPETPNGYLTANGHTWLATGDVAWRNIKIDFEVRSLNICGGGADGPPLVGLRAIDWFNFLAIHFGVCSRDIYKVVNNVYTVVPNSIWLGPVTDSWRKFTYTIENNKYSMFVDGQPAITYSTDLFPHGRVLIKIDGATLIRNFKITSLP